MPEGSGQREREQRVGIALGAWALAALLALALAWAWGRVPVLAADDARSASRFVRQVDLNSASAEELRLLPGIGPAMAKRIVEDRAVNGAFARVEDIERVRGIGRSAAEGLAPHLVVHAPAPPPAEEQ